MLVRLSAICALFASCFFTATAAAQDTPQRPNVLFIMVDDLGWVDTGAYGSTFYETPNVDRLAERGMRFTRAYSASPLCSPTRASVLTGQYPGRIGMTAPHGHLAEVVLEASPGQSADPKYRATANQSVSRLKNDYRTYAEDLQDLGYATGFFGKWHLGADPYIPENQGFDTVVGGGRYPGPPSFFSPYRMPEMPDGPSGEHISDRTVDEAIKFIDAAIADEKPFLLNYWNWDVHAPFQGKEELIAKYARKLEGDAESVQRSAIMGAMIETMDDGVGRLVDALDERGLTDNTIVVFFSDNGGNMYDSPQGVTPTNNAPLRNGKGNIFEGGIRVPLIVVWPDHIAAGEVSNQLACSIDFYPTFADLLDFEIPADQIIDGVSLAPTLLDGEDLGRDSIVIDFPHNVPATGNIASIAFIDGDYKLIRRYWDAEVPTGSTPQHRYELYDLADDISESRNLAEQMPAKVADMDGRIDAYLQETGAVQPIPNPNAGAKSEGWVAVKDCTIAEEDGVLRVTSTGKDPFITCHNGIPAMSGEVTLKLRMKTDAPGNGQVFWTTKKSRGFKGERSVEFEPEPGNTMTEYQVTLNLDSPLMGLRIDPSRGAGTIEIESISLWDTSGNQLHEWTF